jgi:hypothetical protein
MADRSQIRPTSDDIKNNLTLVHFCDVLCDVRVREPFLVLAFNFQDNLTFLLKGLRPGGG